MGMFLTQESNMWLVTAEQFGTHLEGLWEHACALSHILPCDRVSRCQACLGCYEVQRNGDVLAQQS